MLPLCLAVLAVRFSEAGGDNLFWSTSKIELLVVVTVEDIHKISLCRKLLSFRTHTPLFFFITFSNINVKPFTRAWKLHVS